MEFLAIPNATNKYQLFFESKDDYHLRGSVRLVIGKDGYGNPDTWEDYMAFYIKRDGELHFNFGRQEKYEGSGVGSKATDGYLHLDARKIKEHVLVLETLVAYAKKHLINFEDGSEKKLS